MLWTARHWENTLRVRYSRADQIIPRDRWTSESSDDLPVDTLLYTTSVINTPSRIANDINMARERVMSIVLDPIRRDRGSRGDQAQRREEAKRDHGQARLLPMRPPGSRSNLL